MTSTLGSMMCSPGEWGCWPPNARPAMWSTAMSPTVHRVVHLSVCVNKHMYEYKTRVQNKRVSNTLCTESHSFGMLMYLTIISKYFIIVYKHHRTSIQGGTAIIGIPSMWLSAYITFNARYRECSVLSSLFYTCIYMSSCRNHRV